MIQKKIVFSIYLVEPHFLGASNIFTYSQATPTSFFFVLRDFVVLDVIFAWRRNKKEIRTNVKCHSMMILKPFNDVFIPASPFYILFLLHSFFSYILKMPENDLYNNLYMNGLHARKANAIHYFQVIICANKITKKILLIRLTCSKAQCIDDEPSSYTQTEYMPLRYVCQHTVCTLCMIHSI